MDFFERQDKARQYTKKLVVYFGLAVLGIVVSVYLAVMLLFAGVNSSQHRSHGYYNYDQRPQITLWQPGIFLGVAAGVLAIIGGGSAFRTMQLSGGGSVVAESLGGRLVSSNTSDSAERRLLNVVEEMSLASGVPMPQVFVMDGESGINAFAAGHTPSDAVVAVTRGCLQTLNRDELQGVIGHEFSHILNGDMRLNLRLMGIIFGIVCLTVIGRILLRVRSSGKNQNPLPLLGLVLILLGWIGVFFGQLIQAAVSRQREFLADASAVQFTRNPGGLSGALQKIGSSAYGSSLEASHAEEASHMFFSNGLKSSFSSIFATHPPLEERIKAIDPNWDGKFKAAVPIIEERSDRKQPLRPQNAGPLPFPFPPILGTPVVSGLAGGGVRPESVLPNLGNLTPLHLRYAEQMRESLPESVRLAAREAHSAVALIYALLLDDDSALEAQQLQAIARREGSAVQANVVALRNEIAEIAVRARLPLVNLALPALRQLRPDEFKQFSATMQWLIESDGQIDLFEFALQKIIRRHLEPQFGQVRREVVLFYSIKPLLPDCAVLLSSLARVGSSDERDVAHAFQQGVPYLRSPAGEITLLPISECSLEQVDAALNRLVQAAPQIKKNIIEASANVVAADGVMQEQEAELLRAFADSLDCPIPPFVTAG